MLEGKMHIYTKLKETNDAGRKHTQNSIFEASEILCVVGLKNFEFPTLNYDGGRLLFR